MEFLKKAVAKILAWEAMLVLARHKPKIVAVTGSVGKTSTKDAIFAAIEGEIHARKSEKSMNSEFGVPLSILAEESGWKNPLSWVGILARGLMLGMFPREYPRVLVLEVGADRPGDIRRIAKWLRPDVAVFTLVPEVPVHVEYFKSPEEVLAEKRSLAEYLKPGGTVVVNGDDLRVRQIQTDFRRASLTYGFERYNDFAASHEEILYDGDSPAGVRFRVQNDGSSIPVALYGALGRPRVYAALGALAVAQVLGVGIVSAAGALGKWDPAPGRMRLVRGVERSTLIDDTYNSSPAAALAALDTLEEVRGKRKVAVLGDMLELGKYSVESHRHVGKRAAEAADLLVTVGFRARAIAESALDSGMNEKNIRQYEQNESSRAGEELRQELREGDVVLVKGSQLIRMERTVLELMEDPADAAELLVRQGREWEKR